MRPRTSIRVVGLAVLASCLLFAPAVQARTKRVVCGLSSTFGIGTTEPTPIELNTPPEAAVLSSFAVLRRAATPGDQIPALSSAGEQLDDALTGYYPAYVRLLRQLPNGVRYYLVPGLLKSRTIPPADCLPKFLRGKRGEMVALQRKRASELGYCIAVVGGSSLGEECGLFDELATTARAFAAGLLANSMIELVPDGVATVRATFSSAVENEPVSENAYLFSPPAALIQREKELLKRLLSGTLNKHLSKTQRSRAERRTSRLLGAAVKAIEPSKLEWLNAAGGVVQTLRPPTKQVELVSLLVGFAL
jgi:hypothetical protein